MEVLQRGASDLHLIVGKPPALRIDNALLELKDYDVLVGNTIAAMVDVLLNGDEKRAQFKTERELDFSFSFKDNIRFRVNAYFQKGYPAAALRLVPNKIRTIEELFLPLSLKNLV